MKQLTKNTAMYTQINPTLWEMTEESIFSALGDSGLCTTLREKDQSTLSIMVVFLRSGGDRATTHKTLEALYKASHLSLLPSEGLKSIAYTKDLEDEWKWQRGCSLLLAKCFLLTLLNQVDNQLTEEVESSTITKWDAELIELAALRYVALYRLIKKGFKYLKKSPILESDRKKIWDVFIEICTEEINASFVARTNDFQQILTHKALSQWKEITKHDVNRNNFEILVKNQYIFNSHLLLTGIEFLTKKAKRDNLLATYLEDYFGKCRSLGYSMVDALKARTSSGKVTRSEQWENGERFIFYNNLPIKPCYKT